MYVESDNEWRQAASPSIVFGLSWYNLPREQDVDRGGGSGGVSPRSSGNAK